MASCVVFCAVCRTVIGRCNLDNIQLSRTTGKRSDVNENRGSRDRKIRFKNRPSFQSLFPVKLHTLNVAPLLHQPVSCTHRGCNTW
ncbi:Hypothetical protein CINCED_3A002318 [Cinara cedri]|uniref:Uncharacterized protein n=1 Tax=Cinara cedri TaxID=506608 RepID=A0A5E4N092_9HEMI|nr:Hypothetical protein CINCED_3A002318 [Cinara cedri]